MHGEQHRSCLRRQHFERTAISITKLAGTLIYSALIPLYETIIHVTRSFPEDRHGTGDSSGACSTLSKHNQALLTERLARVCHTDTHCGNLCPARRVYCHGRQSYNTSRTTRAINPPSMSATRGWGDENAIPYIP